MGISEKKDRKTGLDEKHCPDMEQLYKDFIKPVYVVAYSILKNKEEAEDIAHDTFLSFLQMEDTKHIKNRKSYLLKMAHNKALNYVRKKNREELHKDVSIFQKEVYDNEQELLVSQVDKEIQKLPFEEQQIFIMHIKAELNFSIISSVMEMSLATVYRKYRKALKSLQKELEGGN